MTDAHDLPLFNRSGDTPVHIAPCGDEFDTAQDAINHAALCGPCAGAAEAALMASGPVRRSTTTRRHNIAEARAVLATYMNHVGDTPDAMQVRRLGWALAHIERTLYYETGRKAGHIHAHSKAALARQTPEEH